MAMAMTTYLANPSALNIWKNIFRQSDRVLVLGSTGWFGLTAMHLTKNLGLEVLALASSERKISTGATEFHTKVWGNALVSNFAPTVVIDCSYLTKDRVSEVGIDEYIRINRQLNENLYFAATQDSVRAVVTISSGAAVYPVDALTVDIFNNPYGYLKREAEQALAGIAQDQNLGVSVARAWSVSGPFVTKPRSYALSDMVIQAQQGLVNVSAVQPVFRRYSSVDELLTLALAEAVQGSFNVLDSEGTLVEMGELASCVVNNVNPTSTIVRANLNQDLNPDLYYSSTGKWAQVADKHSLELLTLDEQIRMVANGILK